MTVLRRVLIAAVLATAVASASVGAAATLAVTGGPLAAGARTVGTCDSAVTVTYVGAPALVTEVTVADIAGICTGGTASVTVTDSSGGNVASGGPVPIDADGSVTIDIPNRAAEVVHRYRVVLIGPLSP